MFTRMLTAAKIDESRNAIQDGDSCGGDEVKFFNGVSEEVDGGEGRSIYIYIYIFSYLSYMAKVAALILFF